MNVPAWQFGRFGLENLELTTLDQHPLAAHELRLRMLASSINYRDVLMIEGKYNPRLQLPLVPLSDGVGEVIETGAEVTAFSQGERVIPLFTQKWTKGDPTREDISVHTLGGPLDGTLSQELVVPEYAVVHVPQSISNVVAATLPCAGLTAWSALVEHGEISDDSRILIEGTGGVSLFALQIAKILGAEVFAISSTDEKCDLLRNLGADETHNYVAEPNWGKAAHRWSQGGVDLVVEVGGAKTLPQALAAVRPGGRITLIGILSGGQEKIDLVSILMNQIRIQGVFVGHRTGFEEFVRFVAQSRLEPVIQKVFPFAQASDALAYVKASRHVGKVVIDHKPQQAGEERTSHAGIAPEGQKKAP